MGRYNAAVPAEKIISYYQAHALPDGWEYYEMDGPVKILLRNNSSNTCHIIVLQKSNASGIYCELMYWYEEFQMNESGK